MIFTDRTITVRKGESRIDEPIVVYRGDYELEVRFTILNSRFKFMSGTNMIESEKASYGQLAILTPYGGNIFSDIVRCNDGSVTFVLTADMLNQIEEVGLYSFQIRLMDYNKESRVSIPPIEFGIEVREPIASEDHDNSVNNAIVGYSIAKVVDPKKENVGDTFNESGNYNKTKWETGDRISEGKLNKIEDAIDKVNKNEVNNTATLSKRIDNNFNVLDSTKADTVITDGLQNQINNLVLESGDSNLEIVQARGGYAVLNDRLDDITNGNGIKNNSIAQHKMHEPYAYAKTGKNLLNLEVLTSGSYVSYINGKLYPEANHCASDFIPVTPGLKYYIVNASAQLALYDANKKYVTGHVYSEDLSMKDMPNNVFYMRISLPKSSLGYAMVVEGEAIPYEPFYYTLDVNRIKEKIPEDKLDDILLRATMSHNLFDKRAVTRGVFVDYTTGNIPANSEYFGSDFIAIDSSKAYTLMGTNEQLATYDMHKRFLQGYKTVADFLNSELPSNAKYLRLTGRLYELDSVQLSEGNEGLPYEKYGAIITENEISDRLMEEINREIPGYLSHNMFNRRTVTNDHYVGYHNGRLDGASGFCASDFIEINPNEYYTISGTDQQYALFDSRRVYITGRTNAADLSSTSTPSNAKYLRITCRESELSIVQVYKGVGKLPYEKFGVVISKEYLNYDIRNGLANVNKITVGGDNCDYDNLREAVESITDATEDNPYEIYINEGVYDIMSYYSKEEYTNPQFIGLRKPAYVSLIGIGDRSKVILQGALPSDTDNTTVVRVSTLALFGCGRIENLTVSAENIRYAIHDDYNVASTNRVVKDCIFIKRGTGGYSQAYGSGVFSGHKHLFENCEFYSEQGTPYSVHNNVNFSTPAYIKLVGCTFVSGKESTPGLRFGNMGSGTKDEVIIIGCETNTNMQVMEEQYNGVGIDFIFKGYSNDTFDVVVNTKNEPNKSITNINGFIKTR